MWACFSCVCKLIFRIIQTWVFFCWVNCRFFCTGVYISFIPKSWRPMTLRLLRTLTYVTLVFSYDTCLKLFAVSVKYDARVCSLLHSGLSWCIEIENVKIRLWRTGKCWEWNFTEQNGTQWTLHILLCCSAFLSYFE